MTDPDLARLCFIHNKQNVTSDGELMSVQLYKMKITRLFEKKRIFYGLLLYTILEHSYSLLLRLLSFFCQAQNSKLGYFIIFMDSLQINTQVWLNDLFYENELN